MLHRKIIPIQECMKLQQKKNEHQYLYKKDDELKDDNNRESIFNLEIISINVKLLVL